MEEEEIVETTNSREIQYSPKGKSILHSSHSSHSGSPLGSMGSMGSQWMEEAAGEGELSVDVYQTADDIIVRAMIPGVRKDDMDISISRDSITIRGNRKEDKNIDDRDFVIRELYWGAFSRTVRLPHEVDIEHAEATENQGLLTIKLPRVDKERQTKLRIKSI